MRRFPDRFARAIAATCLVGLMAAGPIPGAAAQESTTTTLVEPTRSGTRPLIDPSPLEGDAWDLPFASLGYAPTLSPELYSGTIELDVPPIEGLRAVRLRGVIAAAPLESVLVTIHADGSAIAEAEITTGGAMTIDLGIPPGTTALTISARPLLQGLVECPVRTAAVELREPSLVYQGAPTPPRDPDEFLPVALDGLTIAIEERSVDTDQAVVDIVTSLARRYPDRFTVDIMAVGSGTAPRAAAHPFRRTIWVASGETAGVEIVGADGFGVLKLGPNDLPGPFGNPVAPIGIDESGRMALTPHLARSDVDEGVGHAEISIVASQASLGGPHGNLTVRVGGRVTHLAGGRPETTSVALWIGDRLLTAADVDEVGRFDLEYPIDDELVTRDTVLVVTVDAPRTNEDFCDGAPPLRLELDEGSWVGGTPGQPIGVGFARYPQVLLPSHALFVGDALDDLEAAAGLLALLQNASPNALSPAVQSPAGPVTGPALVVGRPSEALDDLAPVVRDGRGFGVDDNDVGAVLTAAHHAGHDVLVLRSTERGAQSRIVNLLRESGFTELGGMTVGLVGDELMAGGRDRTSDRALLPTLSEQPPAGPRSSSIAQLFLYGLLGAAAVVGLALAVGPVRQLLKR